jgi:molybdate transport system substrate-binding protein
VLLLLCAVADAAEIKVLSAGAVEPGLAAAVEAFRAESGHATRIRFATAPALRRLVGEGEPADVVIAPPAVLDELDKAGRLDGALRATLGRVGVGIAVRSGAPVAGVSTVDKLKQSLRETGGLVFNQASTGLYVERLLVRLGLAEELKPRITRYPDGAAVMEHLLKGTGPEIGAGAITEILLYRDRGLRFVGPLPPEVQNHTTYAAAVLRTAAEADAARRFLAFLATPPVRALFAANGID